MHLSFISSLGFEICANPACQRMKKKGVQFVGDICRICWRRQNSGGEEVSTFCCGDSEEWTMLNHVRCGGCSTPFHFKCLDEIGISRDVVCDETWTCPKCTVMEVTEQRGKVSNFTRL